MQFTLKEKQPWDDQIVSFVFEPSQPVTWEAGQFIKYTLPHDQPDEKGETRFFTIAAAPYEKNLTITTRLTGSTFKNALDALQPGDTIEAGVPDGDFVWQEVEKPIVLVAGGIGVTPYYAMLKDRAEAGDPLNATLVYANRNDAVLYKAELDNWQAQHPELTVHYLVGERLLQERLLELVPGLNSSLVYLSGPEPMVESLGEDLKQGGLSEAYLKQDFFPNYDEHNY